ncbi:hypothetical protein BDW71DRAFT_172713 [Aspergillus fruticulosus]
MRPALLRLLKRPSALSVLDSLISSSPGIEHLEARLHKTCLRCCSSASTPLNPQFRRPWSPPENGDADVSTIPSIFRTHPIQTQPANSTVDNDAAGNENGLQSPWKVLGSQLERLDYESDVGHTDDIGTRLVDDPTYRNDFDLWLELLQYRQRHYGDNGTLHVWKGMRKRVGGLQLPVDGETADFFWQSFVNYGLKHEATLNEVVDYALELQNQTGKRWPKLYQSIVGTFVKLGMEKQVVKWHKRLQSTHAPSDIDIAECFTAALFNYDSFGRASVGLRARIAAFREICKHTNGHQVYNQVISALMTSGKSKELLRMHEFLIGHGDHPRSLEELQPVLEYVRIFSSNATKARLQRYCDERFGGDNTADSSVPSLPSLTDRSPTVGVKDKLEENGLKDDFGARIFATRALSIEMIISGFKTFRIPAIGPQSLREMARRARGSHDILEKLDQLEQSKISIGNSVFVRLLRRLAREKEEILLSDLIHSDQHHDVLEDPETQASLLVSHYAARDWRQYNLTLVVLKELLGEGSKLLNIHFQKHLAAGEKDLAAQSVTDMLAQGFTLEPGTLTFMVNYLFGPRKPGRKAVNQPNLRSTHTLLSAFRYLQNIALAGTSVPVKLWIELLKRYGMVGRWEELRTCCLWLARRYSTISSTPRDDVRVSKSDPLVLQQIFDRHMQEAIVSWGFIIEPPTILRSKDYHATGMHGERLVPFVRGILLLRELHSKGVDVQSPLVRRVSKRRLVMLYGQPFFSNRKRNRRLRALNPYTADRVIEDVNRAWGEPELFDEEGKKSVNWMIQFHRPKLSPRHRSDRADLRQYRRKEVSG